MKKILIMVLLVAVSVMMMVGCSLGGDAATGAPADSNSAAPEEIDVSQLVIGVSMLTQDAPYYVAQVEAIQEKGAELGVKEVIMTDAQGDMNKQVSDVEDLLSKGIDILILNPKDPLALVSATKKAMSQGIPVIVIDSAIDESADIVAAISSDNDANGKLVGEWFVGQMGGKDIKLAVMSGSQGSVVGQIRRLSTISGIVETMLQQKNSTQGFEIVTQGWGGWNQEGGLDAMQDILVAHSDINALLAENDSMALGALKAIQEAGLEDQILVFAAADGQKEAYALIKEGKYGATGLNDPALIGETAVDVALRYLGGERGFPRNYYTPPACITIDNVDEYYDPNSTF